MKFAIRQVILPIALVALAALPGSSGLFAQGKGAERTKLAAAPTTTAKKSGVSKKLVKKSAKAKKAAAKKGPPPTPAKVLFGAATAPAPLKARAIGFYAKGCLAGAKGIAIDGPAWQVMRLSRNRRWGHPQLISTIERLAADAKAHDGWNGLLVGDLSQPRGGPMLTGHASHQVGLDADIWLTPMPDRRLTHREREDLAATSMLAADRVSINPEVWTEAHGKLIVRAASYPQVERVLVHPAIKKALCDNPAFPRTHFNKIRPYWGHHYHMHVRLGCPKDSPGCTPQPVVGNEDGCGKEVDEWIARFKRIYAPRPPQPEPPIAAKPKPKPKPKPEITLADLPDECKVVLGNTSPPGPSPVSDVAKPDPETAEAAEPDDKAKAPASGDKPAVAGKK
jgi:penicillin-insensitive murein endopeptidase